MNNTKKTDFSQRKILRDCSTVLIFAVSHFTPAHLVTRSSEALTWLIMSKQEPARENSLLIVEEANRTRIWCYTHEKQLYSCKSLGAVISWLLRWNASDVFKDLKRLISRKRGKHLQDVVHPGASALLSGIPETILKYCFLTAMTCVDVRKAQICNDININQRNIRA